ncbi:MAG: tRNA (adenosine(37)-N6)-threonylcarbamoyltransferase complex dimerization subunit type 1 TsaB [Bacteroidales bacterium]|nr:tRNA (adenosine(37)-N6)-threonylcarbamoyltransferase complex dimerization subunit type 1 TsaB [Bacteroidales bacterium]
MPRIILIETSTSLCSTALLEGDKVTSYRQSSLPREHASKTAVFVREMLDERGLKVTDCDAVCLSAGPGSYTGLRVGSSSAKGLCFGAGIPLLSVGTLDVLARQAVEEGLVPEGCKTIVPMIDARRMEVYSAVYSVPDGSDASCLPVRQTEVKPTVVDGSSYAGLLSEGPVVFIGDGAGKCSGAILSPNAVFAQECPNARSMAAPALKAWDEKRFENTAYFEPFYLKEFVATVSRKGVL